MPAEFARALAEPGQPLQLRSDATQTVSVGLSQTFEAKAKTRPRATPPVSMLAKCRVLSINTSPISYDFEQAKKPGRTGWVTDAITNSFLSDLLPQFTLSLTHDLWRGQVGTDTAKFAPFLSSVSASFAISGNTLRSIGSIFGLGGSGGAQGSRNEAVPTSYVADAGRRSRRSFYNTGQVPLCRGGRGFSANFNYTLSRTRPIPGDHHAADASRTWVSAPTSRRLRSGRFPGPSSTTSPTVSSSPRSVRLERELHEWRAGFNFVRNANGNFAFYFSIYLTDLPDLKFDYDQTTFER